MHEFCVKSFCKSFLSKIFYNTKSAVTVVLVIKEAVIIAKLRQILSDPTVPLARSVLSVVISKEVTKVHNVTSGSYLLASC